MKIIADENLNPLFINDLRDNGHEVISVREDWGGSSDYEVADLASRGSQILVTEDKDFGEMVFAYGHVKITVVFLRYSKAELQLVRRQLMEAIQYCTDQTDHFFITIARGKIRITRL
jgi:predicted nuclease of predicted toxin-antitoxin system